MRHGALFLVATLACGCALSSKGTPLKVRYFSPESGVTTTTGAPATTGEGPKLRLGRVTSGPYLRSRIVFRQSAVELGSYDNRRWTEEPEAYLRRALGRALFEERPLVRAVGGPVPTVDVELIAFEELRQDGRRSGHVELEYVLHDDRNVLASGRLASEREAASADMPDVVAALGAALEAVTEDLAGRVGTRLGLTAPSRP